MTRIDYALGVQREAMLGHFWNEQYCGLNGVSTVQYCITTVSVVCFSLPRKTVQYCRREFQFLSIFQILIHSAF